MQRFWGRQELDVLLEQKEGQYLDWGAGHSRHMQRPGDAHPDVPVDLCASLYLGLSVS